MANFENEKVEPLDDGDSEALALSKNPDFMVMLDKARMRYVAKGGISLEDQNLEASVAQSIRQACERYAVLIDRKFQQSLTPAEQLELESITNLLDKAEKSFYEPIIQRLMVERDKLLKRFSDDRRKAA